MTWESNLFFFFFFYKEKFYYKLRYAIFTINKVFLYYFCDCNHSNDVLEEKSRIHCQSMLLFVFTEKFPSSLHFAAHEVFWYSYLQPCQFKVSSKIVRLNFSWFFSQN